MATTKCRTSKRAPTKVDAGRSNRASVDAAQVKRSSAKARNAFKNFSLSRHATTAAKAGFVAAGTDPKAAHRSLMAAQLARVGAVDTEDAMPTAPRQLNLALTPTMLKKLIPSVGTKAATANVSEVISTLATYARGSGFVQLGNATLRRLALQTQVDEIMKDIQGGSE